MNTHTSTECVTRPRISIITAVHNAENTIESCLHSIHSQDYPSVEHIVIDGSSTDGTAEILRRYADRIDILISEPDKGVYDAMNKGIAAASGEIIGFLNADDEFAEESSLSRIAHALEDPLVDACYGDLVYVRAGDISQVVRYWRSSQYKPGSYEQGWIPAHPTFYARSTVYERFGRFDLQYRIASDVELMVRLIARFKIPTVYIPTVLVRMRLGGMTNRSIRNIVRQNLEIYHASRNNGIVLPFSFWIRKLTNRIAQFLRRAHFST